MPTKDFILGEIRRTAEQNGGVPLGYARFAQETGIRYADWHGKHWAKWSDAVKEAGLAPNKLQAAYSDDVLLGGLAALAQHLGHLPSVGEMKLHRRTNSELPNAKVFQRLGRKLDQMTKLREYCRSRQELADVFAMCESALGSSQTEESDQNCPDDEIEIGFVYLLKAGRFYKIGMSNAAGRREREIALQLPQRAISVHVIRTDDPAGIEDYWHRRFATKRANGEWFALSAADVRAFRRRKTM